MYIKLVDNFQKNITLSTRNKLVGRLDSISSAVDVALWLQPLHHRACLETYRTLVRLQTEVRDRTVARAGPHSR